MYKTKLGEMDSGPDGPMEVEMSVRGVPGEQKVQVPLGYYCDGRGLPELCRGGFYCPTPSQQLPCPEGMYSRQGFSRCLSCSRGSAFLELFHALGVPLAMCVNKKAGAPITGPDGIEQQLYDRRELSLWFVLIFCCFAICG